MDEAKCKRCCDTGKRLIAKAKYRPCSCQGPPLNCAKAPDVLASTEPGCYIALVDKLDEYIEFLGVEIDELVPFAHTHGWRSKRHNEGVKRREEIAELRKAI